MTNSASVLGTIEAGGMKVTTEAAVIKDGGGSVGHWCPHAVWGGRLRRVETLGGSQNFSLRRHYNTYLVNDDGKREALSI